MRINIRKYSTVHARYFPFFFKFSLCFWTQGQLKCQTIVLKQLRSKQSAFESFFKAHAFLNEVINELLFLEIALK